MKRFFKHIFFVLIVCLSGCSSNGDRFQQVMGPSSNNAVVYIFRDSSFVGGLFCPDVKINNEYVGCLKMKGYLRIEVVAGKNEICFCRTAMEVGEDTILNLNLSAGDIRYFEWKPEIGDMAFTGGNVYVTGGKMESIIEHDKWVALSRLQGYSLSN